MKLAPTLLAAMALATGLLLVPPMALPAWAQQPSLPGLADPKAPLEIEADNGLELYQDRRMVVAKGNVVAKQGEVVLRADILSATYEDTPSGQRRIRRIDAVGHVRITTAREQLFGDHVTYDLARELMLVTGKDMRIEAQQQTIAAEDSLEFWGAEQRAVARGNATVTQGTTSLRADVIEALLKPKGERDRKPQAANGGPVPAGFGLAPDAAVDRIHAWGRVVIKTPAEIVEGDTGEYDVGNQLAKLSGNVRISRGKNQLNGAEAIVNLKTGVSRLTGGKGGRVRTILFPGGGGGGLDAPAPQVSRRNEDRPAATGQSQPKPSTAPAKPKTGAASMAVVPRPRPRPDRGAQSAPIQPARPQGTN